MKITTLKLTNFMGVRDFTLDLDGQDAAVSGRNGSGKTTLATGFLWCLFGRDVYNNPSFEVKYIDPETGEVEHNLDHSVEVEFDNGKVFTRTYREKWSRPRGSATKELVGHETIYEVDHNKVTKGNYDKAVAELVGDLDFRLLTDPLYFVGPSLKWQERRALLMGLVEVDDSDLMTEEVAEALGGRSLTDARNHLAGERRSLKRELDAIPVRISEAKRSLPDEKLDVAKIEARIKKLSSGGNELEAYEAAQENVHVVRSKIAATHGKAEALVREAQAKLTTIQTQHTNATRRVMELRERYKAKSADTCPTCGQAQEVPDAEKKQLIADGKKAAKEQSRLAKELSAAQEALAEAQLGVERLPTDSKELDAALEEVERTKEAWRGAKERMAELDEARRQLERAKGAAEAQKRIDDLLAEEKDTAARYEAVEAKIFTLEKYERDRVALVEEAINSRFSLVRFKLFEQQINGGVAETCITTVNGVPYDNLNTATRVHAGLDIIRTLQEHYGARPPVWIDSREGILELPEMDCQVISLVVEDGPLRVEVGP